MSVTVTTQPQPGSLLVSTVEGHRHWSTGLFDCFSDVKSCVISWFCLPCMVCNLASRTGDCACMPFCVPGGSIAIRARVRTLGGIQNNVLTKNQSGFSKGDSAVNQLVEYHFLRVDNSYFSGIFVDYVAGSVKSVLDLFGGTNEYITATVDRVFDRTETVTGYTLDAFLEYLFVDFSKVQLFCLLVLLFLFFVVKREIQMKRKLCEEVKIVGGIIRHNRWQRDISDDEIQEVKTRLERNRNTRIPSIIRKVEEIYKLLDLKAQTLDQLFMQLDFLCPAVMAQVGKLRLVNKAWGDVEDSDSFREIRNVGRLVDIKLFEVNNKLKEMTAYINGEHEIVARLVDI